MIRKIPRGYLLKVQLLDIEPAIWRSFTVPSNITLGDLHHLLQLIMGWMNGHLHGFRDEHKSYGPVDVDFENQIDENSVPLNEIFKKKSSKLLYEYDFGDSWEHLITCKEILTEKPEIAVIGGKRACPPEDCGGVPGYYQILEAITDSDDEEHDDLLDWLGDYDPELFDAEEINRIFREADTTELNL